MRGDSRRAGETDEQVHSQEKTLNNVGNTHNFLSISFLQYYHEEGLPIRFQ